MSLDGSFADIESARDVPVGRASADQLRDHPLARGQAFEARVGLKGLTRRAAVEGHQLGDEPGNQLSWRPDLAFLDRGHRLPELLGVYAPRAVPLRACLEREYPFAFGGSVGQNKDLRRRAQP